MIICDGTLFTNLKLGTQDCLIKVNNNFMKHYLSLCGKRLEQVISFKYLVSVLTENVSCTEEIRSRLTNLEGGDSF